MDNQSSNNVTELELRSWIQVYSPTRDPAHMRLPLLTSQGWNVTSLSMTTILLAVEPVVVPSQAYRAVGRQRFDVA
jgi:hypothetical protein